MKVRTYLALAATAVLVPVVIFSAVVLNKLLDAERKTALRSVQETARATALTVDRELASAEATLRVLGTSSYLAQNDLRAFYEQAKTATESQGSWIVLFDRAGQQLINTYAPFGTDLPRRGHPERGLEIMRMQKLDVSNLVVGSLARQPLISVESPVPLDQGRRYVIAQVFPITHFQQALAQPGIPQNWVLGIFDRQGVVIARSRSADVYAGKPGPHELLQAAHTSADGVLRTRSLEGGDVYGVHTRSAESGWTIGIGVPVHDIEETARRAVRLAGIGLLAALACALGVAAFLARRLAQPMAAASQSALALGRGERPQFAGSGVDEFDTLQAALAEAGRLLERERDSRTQAERERAQLFASEQEARRIAESQNKAKDEFLAMLGHELRNPLGAIMNAVAMLESSRLSEDSAYRARSVIARQGRHLTHIVDDLLDLSRVISGKVFLHRQRIDLAQAVQASVTALHDGSTGAAHMIRVRAATAWIDGDPVRIEQIVGNLLVNACKYTPPAGLIEVTVDCEDGNAVLTVRDSGIGIPADLLPTVFDVFVQGPATLDRAQGGLGVGLSLVRRLVTLHGGMVAAESAGPGRGSTFTVRLPLAAGQVQNEGAGAAPPPATRRGCHVLLVEDNDDNRQTLAAILDLYGYQVTQAGDGTQGLHKALAEPPQVAVVDIGLPGMNGYEVARRLRSTPAAGAVGLIAVTGYGQQEDRQRALDAGFDLHLVKPVDPARLLQAIETLCQR